MAIRAFDFTTWPQSTLLLNESLAARGTELQGDDSRLSCVRASLAAGLRLTTAAIGGSITAGSSYGTGSAGASFLYHSKVSQAINAMYPVQGDHPHHNGGVPGTGPTYMEHCVHDHLPKAAGLILLEYAVNVDRRPASFERLLRRLLISQPQAALIVLNHHRWRVVRPHDGRTDKCWNPKWPVDMRANRTQWVAQTWGQQPGASDQLNTDEDAVAALCKHYNVPLVSQRAALLDSVRLGEIAIPAFMRDCKHPSGEGHTIMAQLLMHRLLHAPPTAAAAGTGGAVEAACGGGGAGASAAAAAAMVTAARASLPPPLLAGGQEQGSSVCARGPQLYDHVTARDGFELTDEGRGPQKLGYVATTAGASISLAFEVGGDKGERHAALWLGFLRSYEHMGRAELVCSGGCACADDITNASQVIDAHDVKDGVSVTDVRRVILRLKPRRSGKRKGEAGRLCAVRLRVMRQSTSGEHKFKLMSLLLGGSDASDLQTFSMRVAAQAAEDDGKGKKRGGRRRRSG